MYDYVAVYAVVWTCITLSFWSKDGALNKAFVLQMEHEVKRM